MDTQHLLFSGLGLLCFLRDIAQVTKGPTNTWHIRTLKLPTHIWRQVWESFKSPPIVMSRISPASFCVSSLARLLPMNNDVTGFATIGQIIILHREISKLVGRPILDNINYTDTINTHLPFLLWNNSRKMAVYHLLSHQWRHIETARISVTSQPHPPSCPTPSSTPSQVFRFFCMIYGLLAWQGPGHATLRVTTSGKARHEALERRNDP